MPDGSARSVRLLTTYAILCTLVVAAVCWHVFVWLPGATVLLVRHAEKADAPGNPSLTDEGRARAEELLAVAEEAGVSAIYATYWCRTVLTAKPLAERLGLTIQVQRDPNPSAGLSSCSPSVPAGLYTLLPAEIDTPDELVKHALDHNRNGVVLIVGHSHTVPPMVEALGRGAFDPVVVGNAFDRLFIVKTSRLSTARRLIKARYGSFSCADGSPALCGP